MTGMAAMLVVQFLLALLILAAGVYGIVALVRRYGAGEAASAQVRNRDRALLARLEDLDDRLERLERTLHDLPS